MKKILFASLLFFSLLLIANFNGYSQGVQNDAFDKVTTGTNTYSVTINAITAAAPYDGQKIWIRFPNANSGASTLKVNGAGSISYSAVAITLNGSALVSGDIPANIWTGLMYYSATPSWQLQKQGSASGSFVPSFPALADQVLRTNGTGGMKANGNSYIDDDGNMSIEGGITLIDQTEKLFFGLSPALSVAGGGGNILRIGEDGLRDISMNNLVGIGTGTVTPGAKLHVIGSGTTSATYGLKVHNSTGTNNALVVRDDGFVAIGTATPLAKFHVEGGELINNIDVSTSGVVPVIGLNMFTTNSTTSGVTSTTSVGLAASTQTNSGENIVAGGFIGINSRMLAGASQSGTLLDAKAINIASPSYGPSPVKPTTNIGLSVSNQGVAGITDSYGILVNAQLNATNSYGIASSATLNGFGTSTPTTALHVVGSIKMVDGSEGSAKVLTSNATGVGSWQTPSAASVSAWGLPGNALTGSEHSPTEFFGSTNNFDVVFKENNAEVMRLINGNVGIGTGTATPTEKLEVNGNIELSGGTRRINFDDGSDIGYIFYDSNNDGLTFSGGGSGLYMDGSVIVASNLNVNGNIGSGTWQGAIIAGQYGGTGVANTGKTITLAGNLTTTGAFNTTFAQQATGTITLPAATSKLLANNLGISGGSTLIGGTGASEALNILSTSNATKGNILFNTVTTADANADVLIGTSSTAKKGLVIQTKAGQTSNAFEVQNSAGTIGFAINNNSVVSVGTWNGSVISGQYGGTGIANIGKTITLEGNLTTTGAFNTTFAQGFTGTITLPTATSTLYSTQTGSITSAQMATSVTDETGTGALVFGTAPTVSTLSVTNTAVIGATGNGVSPTGWALDVRTPSATNGGAIIGGTASGDRAVKIFQSSAGYAYLNGYGRTAGASTDLSFQLDGGNVGIGLTTPTDLLSIKAGTTSLAPILLTSGPLTTGGNIRAGQVQFLTDDYYATITTGTAVHKIARVLTGSATLDFANLVSLGCEDLTVTVTGAVDGDDVVVSPPNGSVVANSDYSAWVSAANTVTVRFCTFISGNPASGTFKVTVIKN